MRRWRGVAAMTVTVAVAVLLALAGCGGGDSGSAGRELVIYSGRQKALVDPLIEQFKQQTGIATSVRYGDTAQLLDKVPARFRADDGSWIGTSGRPRVIVYDPRQVREQDVPDSVFELTKSRWRGKVGIAPSNASFAAFVTALRVLRGDAATRDWLSGMRANDVQTFDNIPAVADLPPLESLRSPQIDLSDLNTLERTLKMITDAGLT